MSSGVVDRFEFLAEAEITLVGGAARREEVGCRRHIRGERYDLGMGTQILGSDGTGWVFDDRGSVRVPDELDAWRPLEAYGPRMVPSVSGWLNVIDAMAGEVVSREAVSCLPVRRSVAHGAGALGELT